VRLGAKRIELILVQLIFKFAIKRLYLLVALVCASPPRLVLLMNRKKVALIDMRVDLSRRNVSIAQQLLTDSEVGPFARQAALRRFIVAEVLFGSLVCDL